MGKILSFVYSILPPFPTSPAIVLLFLLLEKMPQNSSHSINSTKEADIIQDVPDY